MELNLVDRPSMWAVRAFVALVLSCLAASPAGATKVIRWQPDPVLNQVRHGARGMWRDKLWGVSFLSGKTWAFDGEEYLEAGRMPGLQRPMVTAFTDYGVFMMGPSGTGANQKAEIVYSPDGLQDFRVVLSVVSMNKGVPFAAGQDHSLVDLGQGRMMYFEYSEDARLFYSDNQGQDWRLLFQPEPGSIRHFHGAYYDAELGKLYAMSGDSDSQASIMVCDDLFGEYGLINQPDLWRARWGMADKQRSTLEADYFLAPDGVIRSQRTRAVDMETDGDYIYWGEDSGSPAGQSLYRVHRQTQQVNEVGPGDIKGGPWRVLQTDQNDLQFLTASIHFNGELIDGNDDFVHIYQLTDDRTDYFEIARFPSKVNAYSGSQAYGYVNAFGRTWINGYNITEKNLDLVGRFVEVTLGDVNGDDILSVEDIDLLSAQVRAGTHLPICDLDLSGWVDAIDREIWVEQVFGTSFGDANLDGRFGSADLVVAFQAGQYEDIVHKNSSWRTGDWNGDQEFTSADLVYALQRSPYELAASVGSVPEPSLAVLSIGVGWGVARCRNHVRRRPPRREFA